MRSKTTRWYITRNDIMCRRNMMVKVWSVQGAVSHVRTNSCDRVRDVLILGTVYSDIFSIFLPLSFSLASRTFSFILRVYFATSFLTASVSYANVHHGTISPDTYMVYLNKKVKKEKRKCAINGNWWAISHKMIRDCFLSILITLKYLISWK